MPVLTLGWLTVVGASCEQVIDAAARSNFKSVSIRIQGRKPEEPWEPIVGNKKSIQSLREQLRREGLRLSNTSVYHLSPTLQLEDLLPALETTVELGAKIIVATCTDPNHNRWVEFAGRYCEEARKAGVMIALEFAPFSEAKSLEVGYDLVKRVGASNLGLLVDSLHIARSGGQPVDLKKIDPSKIIFSQLCDAKAKPPAPDQLFHEALYGRLYPGSGALPLYDFLDALPRDVEIEVETPVASNMKLPPVEQAKLAADAVRTYLDVYSETRKRSHWN